MNSKNAQVSTVVNQGNILGSLLIYVLPLLLLVGLFMMFSRMQGGARMGFGFGNPGQAAIQGHAQDHLRRRRRCRRGGRGALRDQRLSAEPRRYQALGPRSPGRVALRPPEPVRRCWPGGRGEAGCRSSRSPAPTSSRCSSVWASRVRDLFDQPSKTARASSSSTRSTRSDASAAPA
ncbi:ATP-dependent zinc metalloprotease FtsH domain protein [Mycobacterium xenopi 3993]|nr:ATP-dependent zinc metalloprotease FtsH domain protein [Mycobacterium xenopi 3993]